jgi:AcrR family transcriptional regulator
LKSIEQHRPEITVSSSVRRGRPRGFVADLALEAAMRVFWAKGYDGTTMLDLQRAMGLNRPSLYAAFGNKESLFRLALNRYSEGPLAYFRTALEEPTVRRAIVALVNKTVEFLSTPGNPRACLTLTGALATSDEGEGARKALIELRRTGEAAIRVRLQKGRRDGDFPDDWDPADFAGYSSAVLTGLAIQAANGATRTELCRIAHVALRCMLDAVPDGPSA